MTFSEGIYHGNSRQIQVGPLPVTSAILDMVVPLQDCNFMYLTRYVVLAYAEDSNRKVEGVIHTLDVVSFKFVFYKCVMVFLVLFCFSMGSEVTYCEYTYLFA